MADVFDVEVTIRKNGAVLDGFPYIRRIQSNESQSIDVQKSGADGASFVTVPGMDVVPLVQAVLLRTDTSGLLFKFNNGAGIQLNAGGFILIIDGAIASGASTNVTVNNNTGNTATLTGFCSGT